MVVDTGQFLLVGLHPTTNSFHISHAISYFEIWAGFGLAGKFIDHKFLVLIEYEAVAYISSRNDLLRLYICECLFEVDCIHLHLVRYDQLWFW